MMKEIKGLKIIVSHIIYMCSITMGTMAQQYNCSFKEPVVKIDFGNNFEKKEVNLSALKNYQKNNGSCPDDGNYAFSYFTKNCFNNNWHTLLQDHTPNDEKGLMLIVNASVKPGVFFINYITGLKPGTTYELSCWMVNICRNGSGCSPTPPVISVAVLTDGKEISRIETGELMPSYAPVWKRFFSSFTTPQNGAVVMIRMEDITNGGCGNDFAIDDILIKECRIDTIVVIETPNPLVKPAVVSKPASVPVKPVVKEKVPVPKPVAKETVVIKPTAKPAPMPVKKPIAKETNTAITKAPVNNTPVTTTPAIKEKAIVPVPKPIATRDNPVIKQIETEESELLINLYDNGEIDGDTVSIYHNNQLIVNHAALSENPVTIKVKIDKQHPHHELVMVANNLGSIPPNTSLMVVTANNKRYEIFISSSEQKNAKILIDLKD